MSGHVRNEQPGTLQAMLAAAKKMRDAGVPTAQAMIDKLEARIAEKGKS